jgi:CBS-domain-containing membrane protein
MFVIPYRSKKLKLKTPWPESARELYRPSDRRLSAKLLPTFADRGCHVVSVTDPYGRILGFLDRSRYFFFQVAPQLYLRG